VPHTSDAFCRAYAAWDGHIKKPNNPNVGFLRFSKTRTISLIFGFRRLKRSLFIIANSYHAAAAP
jgi:hypothetical protein